jgi:hypothetical protein
MSSYESIMYQLTSGLISETSIPNEYLQYSEVVEAIKKYNWSLRPSHVYGWTILIRVMNFSS